MTGLARPVFGSGSSTEVQVCRATERPVDGRCFELSGEYSSSYGSDLLVGQSGLDVLTGAVPEGSLRAGARTLAAGQVLLAAPDLRPGERVELRLTRFDRADDGTERAMVLATVSAAAAPLQLPGPAPVRGVLPEAVAEQLGGAQVVGLVVGDDLSREQEKRLTSASRRVDEAAYVGVERGYENGDDRTVLLVLALVAGSLVLAGTLAATSLALTEARPDLATLGQVGARPRTRRLVAGGYALVLGVVGALLGVAAGLVPGVAAAVPLTRGYGSSVYGSSGVLSGPGGQTYVVDLPWSLLLLVVVVLPLLSAGVAAATARGGSDGPRRVVA